MVADLRNLVLSEHQAIAIESVDEERLDAIAAALAIQLGVTLYEWTITGGLARKPDGEGIYGSARTATGLATIADLDGEAIYVHKDLAPQLATPAVSRTFHDVIDRLGQTRRSSALILVGASIELPAELKPLVARYELGAPRLEEYEAVIAAAASNLAASGRASVRVGPDDYRQLATAVSGMTLAQSRHAVARSRSRTAGWQPATPASWRA